MLGLYDSDGVLRFAGRDREDCLAYAELFALEPDSYSLESVTIEATTARRAEGRVQEDPLHLAA